MIAHEEAIRSQVAERYAAGELAPGERAAFEEHIFDCPECAEDVRRELVFAANARAVLRERPASWSKPRLWGACLEWLRPRRALAFSLAANTLLALALVSVLATAARDAIRPRFIPAYFAPGPARGSGDIPVHSIPPGSAVFLAHILSSGPKYLSYSYQIFDAAGKPESGGALSQAAGQESELYLEVPIVGLPAGVHTLEVHGNPGDGIISRSKFSSR
jgi:hypothetical protein